MRAEDHAGPQDRALVTEPLPAASSHAAFSWPYSMVGAIPRSAPGVAETMSGVT
jgi:hypothetical protein